LYGGSGERDVGPTSAENSFEILDARGIAAQQPMLPQMPQVTRLRARRSGGFFERGLEVELLGSLPSFPGIKGPEEGLDFVLAEAGLR